MIGVSHKILNALFGTINWQQCPGCFERHLQRRFNNPLFAQEKRKVTLRELELARIKDRSDRDAFIAKIKDEWYFFPQEDVDPLSMIENVLRGYRQVNLLIDESFALGDSVLEERKSLLIHEEASLDFLTKHLHNDKDAFLDYQSISETRRITWFAQVSRSDTPITKEDIVPSFLCEDLQTIEFMGAFSSMIEHANPNPITFIDRNEIMRVLSQAYAQGFNVSKGRLLIDAFDAGSKRKPSNNAT